MSHCPRALLGSKANLPMVVVVSSSLISLNLSGTDLILSDLDGFWFLFNVFLYSFPILANFSYLSGTDFI